MKKLLILSSVWVEPNSSAAGSRMLQLIELFLTKNYLITYASTSVKSEFSFNLNTIGVKCNQVKINDVGFDDFINKLQPNIVLFDRFIIEEQFGWRVAENLPNTLRILDTEDLHCLRYTRALAIKNKTKFLETDILETDIAKREIASILRCDLSLIISKYEMNLLVKLFKIDEFILQYLPFMLTNLSEELLTNMPTFEQRNHFYFVGNFLHKPNIDCVKYLKEEIWTAIAKALPKVELHIYGAYMPEKIKQLHNKKERFIIKGRAEKLPIIIQNAKICLAPLRFGAGLKGKFIEAMQNFTPSITTSVGAEAMHNNLPWSGSIANSTDKIISESIKLYVNKKDWQVAQKNGINIINQCYGKNYFGKLLLDRVVNLFDNLKLYRQQNFLGQLLQHHTLKSTKYLSKWIEEKEKKN